MFTELEKHSCSLTLILCFQQVKYLTVAKKNALFLEKHFGWRVPPGLIDFLTGQAAVQRLASENDPNPQREVLRANMERAMAIFEGDGFRDVLYNLLDVLLRSRNPRTCVR